MGGTERPAAVAEVARLLASHPLTEPLSDEVRNGVASVAALIELGPGDVLVNQGEPGDAAFLVVAGRLVATVDGSEMGFVGRGETVGEMSLITGEPRSATITAARPSRVVRIGAEEFATVLAAHPETYRSLTAQLVNRLERTLSGRPSWVGHATVVGVAGADRELVTEMAGRLVASLDDHGSQAVAVDTEPGAHGGADLVTLEAENDVVVAITTASDLTGRTHGYDRTLLVARADDAVAPIPAGRVDDLLLVQPSSIDVPTGTARWLDAIGPATHHHVREDSPSDIGRVARRLLRRERVLVLGGGGARGLAHLGTYQALTEAGLDIDAVVGVSAGAVFGACVALDWSPEQAIDRSASMLIDAGSLVDFTIPMVALSSGRRVTDVIRDGFGMQVDLADLWRPMTCISADLTTLSMRLHQRGLLWRAVRASVAVPGVFPPLLEDDAVLVDGGLVDNLPVTRARQLHPGATIISSDVGRRNEELTVDLPPDGIVGGWQTTWRRARRRKHTPSLVKLLYRLTALGGGATESEEGDIHIRHELDGLGMFDFGGARPAITDGYELTKKVLADSDHFAGS